jgi:uncharacterized cupin superfamily protein
VNPAPATPLDPEQLAPLATSGYPPPFATQVLPREKRAIGDAAGITKFGVNYTTLWPGAASSMRHWHTHEDELVYVIEGELVLVTDAGERTIRAGQFAGFPAGHGDGHQLINRGSKPAIYLEIGSRNDEDTVYYPDVDLCWSPPEARGRYTHKDGRTY